MSEMIYTHTNIVASDWKGLAAFYVKVFGCRVVPPERDLSGPWLEELTGIPNVHIRGVHLALPGYEGNTPTLEIFSYEPGDAGPDTRNIHRQGLAHIAFAVPDVRTTVDAVMESGGSLLGSVVRKEYEELGTLTVAYCADPEGNYIEVQNWS